MGCDIHLYREQKIGGKWKSADDWQTDKYEPERMEIPYEKRAYTGRNYNLFGVLAGVRREHGFSLTPRGLPFDMSAEVKSEAEYWDADGHSHSYLYLHELKDLKKFLDEEMITISGMKHKDEIAALKASMETDAPDYKLLYPYCQGTNAPDYEHFEVQIPASFIVGTCLDEIIDSFKDIHPDAEQARAVFWFDN